MLGCFLLGIWFETLGYKISHWEAMCMKAIKLPIRGEVIITKPGTLINLGVADANLKEANANRQKVILGALAIECEIDDIIAVYLFHENKQKKHFFCSWFSSSDWFSFSAKRRVLLAIVNESNLLQGKQKEEFDYNLSKVIKYRNAFTHGDIIETNEGTIISYFEGQQQEKLLSDEYWDELERILISTFERTMQLSQKVKNVIDGKK
jgi:hypothetical protein